MFLGELSKEEDVLEWLVQNKSTGDDEEVIEDVTSKTLNTLIGNIDNLAVLFCECYNKANIYVLLMPFNQSTQITIANNWI